MANSGYVYSEENFRKIVEHAPIGILIIDRSMQWQFVNQRFCEITGYSREELAGKTFLDITYKEDIENNLSLYQKLLDGEVSEYFYEKRYVRKNGQIIWVKLAVAGVRMEGEYSHMVVSVQDIDESKKYEKMLELKNQELDTLFYKASHDLKSPVTTLAGLCHLLRVENENLKYSQSFIHLERTVSKLQTQNEALLELTRIHDWKPKIESISLEHLVKDVVEVTSSSESEIRLTDLDVTIPTDRTLLSIAMRKIIENGIQYRKPLKHSRLFIDYVRAQDKVKISVTDYGTGIPSDELGHIFNMFYKASESSSGSGMGLFIAKKAVEKLTGEIVATSRLMEGSTFSILLPAN
jgi:PAS domain S-box-containing protein